MEIIFRCKKCDAELVPRVWLSRGDLIFDIEPCENCMEREFKAGQDNVQEAIDG
jgi:hypothetical protein